MDNNYYPWFTQVQENAALELQGESKGSEITAHTQCITKVVQSQSTVKTSVSICYLIICTRDNCLVKVKVQ